MRGGGAMTGKTAVATVAAVVFILIMCTAGGAMLSGGSATVCSPPTLTSPASTPPTGGWPAVGTYDPSQVELARVIVSVGAAMGVPTRGSVIAVATAIQESGLRNPTGGDRDSIGLYQQRPSQGWGTPEQLHDPVYASQKFFAKLVTIPNWQQMPLTEAAQAVQISAHPHAYATWEPDATLLVHTVVSGNSRATAAAPEQCVSICASGKASPDRLEDACVDGTAVFARARSWLTAWSGGPVPYKSSNAPDNLLGGYRRDCSGYVSMALGLPGPGLNTIDLAKRSTIITKPLLRPGDLLIKPAADLRGHVVLFERWADTSMSSYWGFEQSGSSGTHYRKIPYPYFGSYDMSPYRLFWAR
jgi:hypothetical protein